MVEKRKCPTCGKEMEIETGLHNWGNLFKKPTLQDWIILFMMIMLIAFAYLYMTQAASINETLEGCLCADDIGKEVVYPNSINTPISNEELSKINITKTTSNEE